jgi:hypothetical protein
VADVTESDDAGDRLDFLRRWKRLASIRARAWRCEIGGSYPDWHSQVHYSVCFLQGHELAVNGFQSKSKLVLTNDKKCPAAAGFD